MHIFRTPFPKNTSASQLMSTLETDYWNLFKQYIDGYHILRRTSFKCWGGISIDQGNEETFMRNLKSEGSLIRGRGFNNVQINLFIFSYQLCAEITDAIEKLSTIIFIVFWDFLMFYQIFLSPQVKRCTIIVYKHCIYELPHELRNNLKLRILGN